MEVFVDDIFRIIVKADYDPARSAAQLCELANFDAEALDIAAEEDLYFQNCTKAEITAWLPSRQQLHINPQQNLIGKFLPDMKRLGVCKYIETPYAHLDYA